jgi:choline dehydrogenase-like flavoprotein
MGLIYEHQDYRQQNRFEADVVVVGTGAGGGVAGCELAEAGYDVVFVEEGGHHPTSSFNPFLSESVPRLYRDASATVIMGKPPIPYLEGRCVGGSTVVNGGMTYRAPEEILEHWQHVTGSSDLGVNAMEHWFRRVEGRINASPQLELSVGDDSRIMTAGAKKMGWRYTVNRRAQQACVGANNCTLGCPTGAKQSTLVTYFPRALEHGARCLTEVKIDRLLMERGRCVGVAGHALNPRTRAFDRPIEIHARATIIACGAIQTPFLLLGQGIGGREMGRNLSCHPNAKVLAVYPHDIHGWKGVSQHTQVREFRDEGLLFAENFVAPGALAAFLPFHGAAAWELMQRYNQMIVSGVLVEDSNTGRVRRRFGMPYARYDITDLDHRRFVRGVKLLSRMHFEMGAEFVILPFSNQPVARCIDDLETIEKLQTDRRTLELFTVHLMGTARMGTSRDTSVVDLNGQLWDLPGCYIADASIFPTAIGVNPQVTIMALATRIAQSIHLPKAA